MKEGTRILTIVCCILLAVGMAIGIYFGVKDAQDRASRSGSQSAARKSPVVDCSMKEMLNAEACESRGCIWRAFPDDEPKCTFKETDGYQLVGELEDTPTGFRAKLKKTGGKTIVDDYFTDLVLEVEYQTESRVRLKFSVFNQTRYEVPKEALDIPSPASKPAAMYYEVKVETSPFFGVKVVRKSTGVAIFHTTVPGFYFSDQFIQLTTKLPSEYMYGLGEHNHQVFKHDLNWKTWSIFAQGEAPIDDFSLYGVQPFYMCLEKTAASSSAHGVYLKSSNAMDILLQPHPYPALTYRVIGGILDFYLFMGPTPENIVQQYTMAIGRPMMPPYWTLGFQLSKWDYGNITNVFDVVERNRRAGIPMDVQYGDIDYMQAKLDFTFDKDKYSNLPELVQNLHDHGQRYIIILDPGISNDRAMHQKELGGPYHCFEDGLNRDVYIRAANGSYIEAQVWPGKLYFPDYTLPETENWWLDWCHDFYSNNSGRAVKYDGLWIDMNEPKNFVHGSTSGCEVNKLNNPPYTPKIHGAEDNGKMYFKTLCMDSKQNWGRHYDVHSLYGHSMSIQTFNVLRKIFPSKRPFVLTRSQFTGSNKYAGHWLGDNQSLWPQMAWSIVGMLEYSLFGFSYTGSDICGFWYNATEEMCTRWMQLGAFYPFSRNHNAIGFKDQDPAAWSDAMIKSSRDILLTRYKLLPYLYTLFHYAHVDGNTVARPLMHEFLDDQVTWEIGRQFLWGPALLISPCLDQGCRNVRAYFPDTEWYDYFTGAKLTGVGAWKDMHTPLDKINVHVRGGHIIPWQQPANTTHYSRQNSMGLLVAMNSDQKARGSLFWDDGESFETFSNGSYTLVNFVATEAGVLSIKPSNVGYATDIEFDTINLWGLNKIPTSVTVNGVSLGTSQIGVDRTSNTVTLMDLNLRVDASHTISWSTFKN